MIELPDRLFITVSELAEVYGADQRTVRRGIDAGDIPAVKVGHTTRIPTAWVRQVAGLPEAATSA